MKKLSKKLLAVLLCAWNLYLPNNISEDDEIQVNNAIVEELPPIANEVIDDLDDDEEKKDGIKRIFYFIPTVLFSSFKAIMALITGILTLNPITLLIFGLLLLAAFLLMNKKHWGAILGILAGCLIIQQAIEQVEIVLGGWVVGLSIIVAHLILGYLVYKKTREIKKEIVEKITIINNNEEIDI